MGVVGWSMMTSSNGNIFRVTGHLCGEFTGDRWIPVQKPVEWNFDVFFDLHPNKRLSKQMRSWWFETPSRHYDVTVVVMLTRMRKDGVCRENAASSSVQWTREQRESNNSWAVYKPWSWQSDSLHCCGGITLPWWWEGPSHFALLGASIH